MGCAPSLGPSTAVKPAENTETNRSLICTINPGIKLKEVWVIVKQNNFKKLDNDLRYYIHVIINQIFSLNINSNLNINKSFFFIVFFDFC
jgi:hypothetical protein